MSSVSENFQFYHKIIGIFYCKIKINFCMFYYFFLRNIFNALRY